MRKSPIPPALIPQFFLLPSIFCRVPLFFSVAPANRNRVPQFFAAIASIKRVIRDMPQSRRPERPRSSRDHHSKPLGAICRSSASTFSAGATLKCHISGIPALPETRGIPGPPGIRQLPGLSSGSPSLSKHYSMGEGAHPPIKRAGAGSGIIRDFRDPGYTTLELRPLKMWTR